MHHHGVHRMTDQRGGGAGFMPRHGIENRCLPSVFRAGAGLILLKGHGSTFGAILWNKSRALRLSAMALMVAACDGPLSTLQPAGPVARSLAQLGGAMFVGGAVLVILMAGLFALVILRPHWAARISARNWIIWGGLILPAIVLPPLVAVSLIVGERLMPSDKVPRIEAEAQQWYWTFRYPDHGGTQTEGLLHLPSGQAVDIVITSRDVIHSFWVPRLAGKMDAVPGRENVLRLLAGAPGPLEGVCAEFCGLDHTTMRFDVQVHDPEGFAKVLSMPMSAPPP